MNSPVPNISERVEAAFRDNPSQMTPMLADKLGITEAEVIRYYPDKRSTELDIGRWEELLRSFEALGKVHVIVNSGVVTLEVFGSFGNFSTWGPFFNVQTSSLDMHIRHDKLGSAFALQKPSHMDGVDTLSVQFFTTEGKSAFKVFLTFGSAKPTEERQAQFAQIQRDFALAST